MDKRILDAFRSALGPRGLISEPNQLKTYECDGLTNFRVLPAAVLLPETSEQVQAAIRICHKHKIPFVARGSGTGLSGGALPVANGVVISLARMNRILEVDIVNQRVAVEPGVINAFITQQVAPYGYFYAPDPSSQQVCSIGGNVAENSGGAHCLKYGFTTTHVLGMDVVLPDGKLVQLGSSTLDSPGYDLAGVFVGSEGTLGVVTRIILRIVKRPEVITTLLAAFNSTNEAGEAVSEVIGSGVLPAAIEMMDNLAIQAAEASVHAGYPNCGGLLLVELDGTVTEVETLMRQVNDICQRCGAWEIRLAHSEAERMLVWKGRKAAFAAMGRISPNYIVQDGVIPRTALPQVMNDILRLSRGIGAAGRQRLSRGRWQSASAGALRSPHCRPGTPRRASRRRHPAPLHQGGRFDHRRARRRRGKENVHGGDVRRTRPRHHATGSLRLRSRAPRQPRQGVSAASLVR